jgi:hypothetical protein
MCEYLTEALIGLILVMGSGLLVIAPVWFAERGSR